mgnify:CR=1 FL=1
MFGYEEGAFTGAQKGGRPGKFELADTGTLFLDESRDMPFDMQVKLLRVLQSGENPARGRFAHRTRGPPHHLRDPTRISSRPIAQHQFRADLYYRIQHP